MRVLQRSTTITETTGTSTVNPPAIVWVPVAPGLWAGSTDGDFAGLIEQRSGRGYLAQDGRGGQRGIFATLDEAKLHLSAKC